MAARRLTRRRLLIAAPAAAPLVLSDRVFGAGDRVGLGLVGLGGQGLFHLNLLTDHLVAICDVDRNHVDRAAKLVPAAKRYADYRKLLEQQDVDAVLIATPDHWHALPTIHACQAGKDVYCEKPLSLTVVEGRKMVEAARRHKRIVQTGTQQRSESHFRIAGDLVRGGRLGKIREVRVGIPGCNVRWQPVPDAEPPAYLDYDVWLGPAPKRPYNINRIHYNFRFFWDYSGGQMTNWGAHHIDIAQWALGMDGSGPVAVSGTAEYHPERWFEVPVRGRVTLTYANGVTLIVGQQQADAPLGVTFEGSDGRLFVTRGKIAGTCPGFEPPPPVVGHEAEKQLHSQNARNHHRDFFDAVRSRKPPLCDVEIGHRSATVCHLANIASRLGRAIRWDPQAERILDDAEAAAMCSRPYRAPWTL
jgi:predicted dehydrogenase